MKHIKKEFHKLARTSEYKTWANMKQRCYNKNDPYYYCYGGRGIIVCDKWKNSFIAFFEDMGKKPFPKAQIDREENDGNYEPNNCRWVTSTINIRNSSLVKLTLNKAKKIRNIYATNNISQRKLAKNYNVSQSTIKLTIANKIWREE